MNKSFLGGIYFSLGILLVFSILGIAYAIGFHSAEEILPGTFSQGNFIFNGSIGIETSSPLSKLDVNGKIIMRNETNSSDSNETVATKGYVDGLVTGLDCQRTDYTASINNGAWLTRTCAADYKLVAGSCDSDNYYSVRSRFVGDNQIQCSQTYGSGSQTVIFHYVCCK